MTNSDKYDKIEKIDVLSFMVNYFGAKVGFLNFIISNGVTNKQ